MNDILLLSGGADSALCLHDCKPTLAIGYDYGQRALIELEYAQRLAWQSGVRFEVVQLPHLPLLDQDDRIVRAGRNAVMLAHAASVAQARGFENVIIGCNATDAERFPDCRSEFIVAMGEALFHAYGIGVMAPLLDVTKQEILRRCRELKITDTWSCYTPRDGKPCGECYACQQRTRVASSWLLERGQQEGQVPTLYWCQPGRGDYQYGHRWTEDANKAYRFASFSAAMRPYDAGGLVVDVDAPVDGDGNLYLAHATEHVWIGPQGEL